MGVKDKGGGGGGGGGGGINNVETEVVFSSYIPMYCITFQLIYMFE